MLEIGGAMNPVVTPRSRDDRLGGLLVITAALAVLCLGMTGCSGPSATFPTPPGSPSARPPARR